MDLEEAFDVLTRPGGGVRKLAGAGADMLGQRRRGPDDADDSGGIWEEPAALAHAWRAAPLRARDAGRAQQPSRCSELLRTLMCHRHHVAPHQSSPCG